MNGVDASCCPITLSQTVMKKHKRTSDVPLVMEKSYVLRQATPRSGRQRERGAARRWAS